MRSGGGGREAWMLVIPVVGLLVLGNVVLGGPDDVLRMLERVFLDVVDSARNAWRR